MNSLATRAEPAEPVISDPEIAAEFAEFKRRWPVIGAAAEHPLTELIIKFSRHPNWVFRFAACYMCVAAMALVLWPRQHYEVWIFIALGVAPLVYADRKKAVRKLFFTANADLALMPISVQQYVAIRLAAEFIGMRRVRRIAWRSLSGIVMVHLTLYLSLRFVVLPISDLDVLRSFLLVVWCDLNLFIFPSYKKLLSDKMGQIYYSILFGKSIVFNFWMVQAAFWAVLLPKFHGFLGVGVYVLVCVYYHAFLLDAQKKIDLEQYFRDYDNYAWEFETDKRGKWKFGGRKIGPEASS